MARVADDAGMTFLLMDTFALNPGYYLPKTERLFESALREILDTSEGPVDVGVAARRVRLDFVRDDRPFATAEMVAGVPVVHVSYGFGYRLHMQAAQVAAPSDLMFHINYRLSELDRAAGHSRWFDPIIYAKLVGGAFEPDPETLERWQRYLSIAVLLHELCHHQRGDTLPANRTKVAALPIDERLARLRELEIGADRCAAVVMLRQGIEYRILMELLLLDDLFEPEETGSGHPGARERLNALNELRLSRPGSPPPTPNDEGIDRELLLGKTLVDKRFEEVLPRMIRGRWPTCPIGWEADGSCMRKTGPTTDPNCHWDFERGVAACPDAKTGDGAEPAPPRAQP